jgi:hypothetical protein
MGYGSNWMHMSLDNDSDDEGPLDPHKELNEYLDSKREERKEGLVEWWGVSLACILSWYPTDKLLLYVSIILFITLSSPASHETILPFKGPRLPRSKHSRAVGSQGLIYAIVSRQIPLRHSRSSRVHTATGFSMPAMKQQLMWLQNGISVDWSRRKIP